MWGQQERSLLKARNWISRHLDPGLPRLHSCKEINVCCWSRPVCGTAAQADWHKWLVSTPHSLVFILQVFTWITSSLQKLHPIRLAETCPSLSLSEHFLRSIYPRLYLFCLFIYCWFSLALGWRIHETGAPAPLPSGTSPWHSKSQAHGGQYRWVLQFTTTVPILVSQRACGLSSFSSYNEGPILSEVSSKYFECRPGSYPIHAISQGHLELVLYSIPNRLRLNSSWVPLVRS